MNTSPVALKIAAPYANALFDFTSSNNMSYQIVRDIKHIKRLLMETKKFDEYLSNPTVSSNKKLEIIEKTLDKKINNFTLKFLLVLVKRNRIDLLETILFSYENLTRSTSSVILVEVLTAFKFSATQSNKLMRKVKRFSHTQEVMVKTKIDSTLIGGFSVEVNSRMVDYTIKTQLQKLANHLDSVLEI